MLIQATTRATLSLALLGTVALAAPASAREAAGAGYAQAEWAQDYASPA
ncbi:MAG: murein L,D-transpeptidase, partial [Methylobacterium sp.]